MDWFLYDNGLHYESVNVVLCQIKIETTFRKKTYK